MSEHITLKESIAEAPVKKGNRWRVIVARPGQGSSGKYSEDLFRRDAHKIIAPGAQSFINHDDSRNPKDMIGVFPEAAYFDESENAVVAELEVFSHWRDFVEEVGPHCGISLYAMGEADADGNITEIFEDRLNGADLVARPGLIGSGLAEKLYESAVSAVSNEKPGAHAQETDERNPEMDELIKAVEALSDQVKSLVAEKADAEAEKAQVEADEKAVSSAVEAYDAAVKAIDEADLFESQVAALRAEAREGKDVAPLIEAAKQVKKDAEAAATQKVTEAGGVAIVEGSKGFSLTKIAEAK